MMGSVFCLKLIINKSNMIGGENSFWFCESVASAANSASVSSHWCLWAPCCVLHPGRCLRTAQNSDFIGQVYIPCLTMLIELLLHGVMLLCWVLDIQIWYTEVIAGGWHLQPVLNDSITWGCAKQNFINRWIAKSKRLSLGCNRGTGLHCLSPKSSYGCLWRL